MFQLSCIVLDQSSWRSLAFHTLLYMELAHAQAGFPNEKGFVCTLWWFIYFLNPVQTQLQVYYTIYGLYTRYSAFIPWFHYRVVYNKQIRSLKFYMYKVYNSFYLSAHGRLTISTAYCALQHTSLLFDLIFPLISLDFVTFPILDFWCKGILTSDFVYCVYIYCFSYSSGGFIHARNALKVMPRHHTWLYF